VAVVIPSYVINSTFTGITRILASSSVPEVARFSVNMQWLMFVVVLLLGVFTAGQWRAVISPDGTGGERGHCLCSVSPVLPLISGVRAPELHSFL